MEHEHQLAQGPVECAKAMKLALRQEVVGASWIQPSHHLTSRSDVALVEPGWIQTGFPKFVSPGELVSVIHPKNIPLPE